jgi:arylsulfatase A-like enzyme
MSEYFQDQGFYTMLYGASGFLGTSANMLQGYDEGTAFFEPTAPTVVAEAWDLIEERPTDQPFMMHVHFIDPHMPFIPPESYLKELAELEPTAFDYSSEEGTLAAWIQFPNLTPVAQEINLEHMFVRYDAEIRYTDDQIERFLFSEDSPVTELLDDTLIVFYSDHGEEFWEHENFNHGYNNFDEVVRVPAALWWPDGLEPATLETITLHEDLLPTIFAIFGFEPDPAFTGVVVGEATGREQVYNLVWREDRTHQSVTDGAEKLMYRWDESDLLGGPKYFYDLVADPMEQVNLYDPKDPRVQYWWDLLLPQVEALDDAEPDWAPVNPGP